MTSGKLNPLVELDSQEAFIPIIRPTLPEFEEVEKLIQASWRSGVVTVGRLVKEFETQICRLAKVRHAVALSSCTAGLMLVPRALNLPAGSEVIVPSFTFAATVQALVWNGLIPVFCDCLPGTLTMDPDDAERNVTARTAAICPVYIYGLPPDNEAITDLGRRKGLPVYFDSAQGMGSTYASRPAGAFGVCEVFSFSPTKVVTAVEAGAITTNDEGIAERLRSLRDYGKDPDRGEDMLSLGLSARLGELNAAVGILSLKDAQVLVDARRERVAEYRERLGKLPGCRVQAFPADRRTNGNYFVLFITRAARRSRDEVQERLLELRIQTKRYFYPPVHTQTVFQRYPMRVSSRIDETIRASQEALALPLYSHMTDQELDTVCQRVEAVLA